MKKNIIIAVLALLAIIGAETSCFFYYQTTKLNYQKKVLCKSLSRVRADNDSLRSVNNQADNVTSDGKYKLLNTQITCFRALQKND